MGKLITYLVKVLADRILLIFHAQGLPCEALEARYIAPSPIVPGICQLMKPMCNCHILLLDSAILGGKACMKCGDQHHQMCPGIESLADVERIWGKYSEQGGDKTSRNLQALPVPYLRCNGSGALHRRRCGMVQMARCDSCDRVAG